MMLLHVAIMFILIFKVTSINNFGEKFSDSVWDFQPNLITSVKKNYEIFIFLSDVKLKSEHMHLAIYKYPCIASHV